MRTPYSRADGPTDLIINEVLIGPGDAEFIEVWNPTESAKTLANCTLVTGVGSFDLATYTSSIPSHGYFCLMRDIPANEGVGDKRISVTGPLALFRKDTVLLKRSTTILDAVALGPSADTSSRYTDAVAAGQFSSGSFVNTTACIQGTYIARDSSGTDTNSNSDWKVSYQSQAAPSPLAANAGAALDESFVPFMQMKYVHEILAGGYGISVTANSHSGYSQTATHASAAFSLTTRAESGVAAPFNSANTLTGTVTTDFAWTQSGYTYEHSGALTSSSLSLTFTVQEAVTLNGRSGTITASATLSAGTNQYPYSIQLQNTLTGNATSYATSDSRSAVDMSGQQRTSTSTAAYTPSFSSGDDVGSVTANVSIESSYPTHGPTVWAYADWVSNGSQGSPPSAVTTTLQNTYTIVVARGSAGSGEITFTGSNHTMTWGDGTSRTITGESGSLAVDADGDLSGAYTFSYTGSGSHTVNRTVTGQVYANGDLQYTGEAKIDGQSVVTFDGFIDGWVWNFFRRAAVTAGCAMATAGATGLAGGATAGTGGAAGPLAGAGVAVVIGVCTAAMKEIDDRIRAGN